LAHPFLVGFSQAMGIVFTVGALVVVVAVVLSSTLKEVPLRLMSGQQARAMAAADEARAVPVGPNGVPTAGTPAGAAASAAPVDVMPMAPLGDAPPDPDRTDR
jgi:acyl-CoA synthetase (NDP forming)